MGERSASGAPPWQCCPMSLGGTSVSGYGVVRMPQALLCVTRLCTSVSNRPPAMTMPVPTGPAAADPASGTLGSLLSCTQLLRQISHEDVPVGPLPYGHEPYCGDGTSSLF